MLRKILQTVMLSLTLIITSPIQYISNEEPVEVVEVVGEVETVYEQISVTPKEKMVVQAAEEVDDEPIVVEGIVEIVEEPEIDISEEDIELIALVTMAEAEGECEEGKRLVIDTILNRVDSEHFPDTVREVIYQKDQFSSMWNGRINRCYVKDDICQLVREEMMTRTNYEVAFFHARRYGNYGVPMFSVGNHYFSSYD